MTPSEWSPTTPHSRSTPYQTEAQFLARLAKVVSAKANKILDRYDDPREAFDYANELEAAELQDARSALAAVIDTHRHLDLECHRLHQAANDLEAQAVNALRGGDDQAAREALARKEVLSQGLAALNRESADLSEEAQSFAEGLNLLERKVLDLRTRKQAIEMQASEAGELQGLVVALEQEATSIKAAIRRSQRRVEVLRTQASTIDGLLSSGSLSDLSRNPEALATELDRTRSSDSVTRELSRIRDSLKASGDDH